MPIRPEIEGSSDTLTQVGRRLRAIRELAGVRQEVLCGLLGVDQSTYSKWEQGKRLPNVLTLSVFARRFKTSLDFLFRGLDADMHPDLSRLLRVSAPDLFSDASQSTASDTDTVLSAYKASIAVDRD